MPCSSIAIRSIPSPHAKPVDPLGVVAGRVRRGLRDRREDVRVDLAGAEDLEPALALAQVAARAVGDVAASFAVEAGNVDLDARLGEGEEVGAKANLAPVAEHGARELQERPLRSASVMSSSTASPSIWWNWGVCVASESGRYTRPGITTYSGGGWASIARICIGEVCVRSTVSSVT